MITLIGMGSGTPGSLTAQCLAALQGADRILGAKRLLATLPEGCTGNRQALYKPDEILACLAAHPGEEIALVYSGATGFYSGASQLLPMLRACLGSGFTAAGVGDVISDLVSHIIPEGNVNAGIVVYAIGMMLFTMIMGNAYAAITVMTVGIGYPFVLAHGANPVVIGMMALPCGVCGTQCTTMAANFNTVPVALLDMKKPMGVIKNQVPVAIIMMVVQIVMMILLK